MTDSGRIPGGFDLILYGVVDTDGFLIGGVAAGAAAGDVSSMKRLYGAKTAPVAIKEPEVLFSTGDNDALVSFQFEAAELPDGVLTLAQRDLDFDALVQGTAAYTLHSQKFGALQPGNANPPNMCLLLMRRAKTWGAGSKGIGVWDCMLVPSCTITPLRSEFTERAINAEAYRINTNKSAHFVWGETVSSSNLGTDSVPVISIDSDNPIHAMAFLGDGVTDAFDVPYTPVSDARSMIFVERVEKAVTTHWTRSGKTFTFTGGNVPIATARGVIWYETSATEIV